MKPEDASQLENGRSINERQPWWLILCWIAAGLVCDLRCAYHWFFGREPIFSDVVVRAAALVFVLCAAIALSAVWIFSKVRLRDAPAVFAFISAALSFEISLSRHIR
jgi:hypothetical protein